MEMEKITQALENTFGPMFHKKDTKDKAGFISFTVQFNKDFWNAVKTVTTTNDLKRHEFITNAAMLYFLALNNELPEDKNFTFTNPDIKNTDEDMEQIKSTQSVLVDEIDSLKKSIKLMNVQLDTLIGVMGGQRVKEQPQNDTEKNA